MAASLAGLMAALMAATRVGLMAVWKAEWRDL